MLAIIIGFCACGGGSSGGGTTTAPAPEEDEEDKIPPETDIIIDTTSSNQFYICVRDSVGQPTDAELTIVAGGINDTSVVILQAAVNKVLAKIAPSYQLSIFKADYKTENIDISSDSLKTYRSETLNINLVAYE